jgi:hypothetical protein
MGRNQSPRIRQTVCLLLLLLLLLLLQQPSSYFHHLHLLASGLTLLPSAR